VSDPRSGRRADGADSMGTSNHRSANFSCMKLIATEARVSRTWWTVENVSTRYLQRIRSTGTRHWPRWGLLIV
jgi:hypothetical protein